MDATPRNKVSAPRRFRLGPRRDGDHALALERVRGWVRARFALGDAAVLVAEVACGIPGCPPIETAVAFWCEGRRHHFKVFKPVAAVTEDDLPPSFMKRALAVPDDFECTCC